MADPTHLAWCDLETTGSDERRDSIIEFALIVTDMSLNVVYEHDTVVQPVHHDWHERIMSIDAVADMHTANGLINEVMAGDGDDIWTLDRWIVEQMEYLGLKSKDLMLAGSGVGHFDRRFIRVNMKQFDRMLAYPVIDVGVLRRFIRDVIGRPDMIPASGDGAIKAHRAMDDLVLHLSEARYYRNVLGAALDRASSESLNEEKL